MLKLKAFLFLVILLCAATVYAAQLYSDAELEAAHRQMASNITLMVTEDIVRTIPRDRRPAAAKIQVTFKKRGPNPLAFWSDPATATVYVPMESVRFIDDLAILQAWFERHRCAAEYISTYLWALLREGRPLPSPLSAFGIDRERALADDFVRDVSSKVLRSSIFFILAHEVGHIMLGHKPGLRGEASQQQEVAADAFALDRFASIGAPPAGMVLYFLAGRWRDPIGTAASLGTHPVSPERISAIAKRMAADPEAFSFAEPDPQRGREQVLAIARELRSIAELSSDERMLTLLPLGLARDFPLSRLRSACVG